MRHLMAFWLLLLASVTYGQYEQNEDDFGLEKIPAARSDVRWLVDSPTAYMLPRGSFDIDLRTFPEGGVQASLNIGLADIFSVGICYGGAKILSERIPEWNARMEFKLRFRLIEESESFPQVAVGFSSFGYGLYQEKDTTIGYEESRYLVKSPGFYLSLSRKYPLYSSSIEFHGGVGYSLENEVDGDPNVFIGMVTNLGYRMIFITEYDFAINDNKPSGIFGRGRGYLNLGLAWYITSDLSLEVDFKNLLSNRRNLTEDDKIIDREVRLVYLQFFKD